MTSAVVASEYADEQTILAILGLCIIAGALIGRWWSLLLPIALIVAAFGAAQFDWYYERVPEDIQGGIVFGAVIGLVLGALTVLVRQGMSSRH